ncbi:MAG: domain protein beta Propeller, partial [Verrucomicrobiales bacterium]|nr:domain protein beta Propeller [Verrucomicrobiales bacterium]
GSLHAQKKERIEFEGTADLAKAIPVSLTGFSGEARAVLETDLYVIGFEFVDATKAKYIISGSNNGHVEGRVTDAAKGEVLKPKAYNGGTSRAQAHAFANDIAVAFGQKPIFFGQIAFRKGSGENAEIYIADFDGNNAQQVTHDGKDVKSPCWVPGKRQLVYTSYKSTTPAVYLQDLESGDRRPIAQYGGSSYSPSVSPNGQHFAFVSSMSGRLDLYLSAIDGSGLKALTKSADYEASPSWSADGSKICYSAPYKTRAALYTISPNGGEPHRLNVGGFVNLTEAAWSPDGKQIVFTAQMVSFRICVVPAQGGEAKEITDAGEDPSWAPNSRTVIFTRRKGNGRVLSLLDVPTKHVKDIAQISGSCSQPSWAK